ncbi:hypothetical protein CEXT_294071 [Caerostris extrusa]|uniref:Uncharacterized protein n=1 Tax=Caerostris extrusa TaxID=172846 RepID=A0AAV4XXN5_CAEEX|nr:hypothetical protein CEXT_294071 [Caerostris extrusa]
MTEVSRTQKDNSKKKVACLKAIADNINASLVNSYIVYVDNHNTARNSHQEVRLRIARGLIGGFCSKKRKLQSSWVATKKEIAIPQEIRTTNVETHMPEKGKYTEGENTVAPKPTRNGQTYYVQHIMFHLCSFLFYVVSPE